jgi:1,4-alpha-glucan branching enzyme
VVVYRRKGKDPDGDLVIVLNLTPVVRRDWKVYTRGKSAWKEIFNSDDRKYWGTGDTFNPDIPVKPTGEDNWYELTIHLPPLAGIVLK